MIDSLTTHITKNFSSNILDLTSCYKTQSNALFIWLVDETKFFAQEGYGLH